MEFTMNDVRAIWRRGGLVLLASASACTDGTVTSADGGVDQDGRVQSDSSDPALQADGARTDASGQGGSDSESGIGAVDGASVPPIMGGPACGLPSAAFCDRFDAPADQLGRAGELDTRFWSAGRVAPQFTTGNGVAIGIGPGTVPACRTGQPATVLPSRDALICSANAAIADNHLLVVAAAQNYGQSSYRIRQPFDFSNRTGVIVFDAEGFVEDELIGWISLDVTEDPVNAPSFAVGGEGTANDEGSQWPRSGFEVQFQTACATDNQGGTGFAVRFIDVFQNYKSTVLESNPQVCTSAARGQLNHFEVHVSAKKIEVFASPVSADGTTFAPVQLLQSADVDLPFTRGYVQISTHNHASIKYSHDGSLDAWAARWNNVGFDGPVIENWREYEVPDSLKPGEGAWNRSGPVVSVGYRVSDVANGPGDQLTLKGVKLADVLTARLSLSAYYPYWNETIGSAALRFRLNGKPWHDRPLNTDELGMLRDSHTQGQIIQMIDVPLDDLVEGDNVLEFVSVNVDQGYPAAVANIDLVLGTK